MVSNKTGVLSEDYRPQSVSDCILPERIKKPLLEMVAKGDIPHLLFEGGPGCGKTTAALAICKDLDLPYLFINGSEQSGIDVLRTKVRNFASQVSVLNPGKLKVVIFDEADYLNANSTQPALRGFIQEFSATCRFFFTCNYKNKLFGALHSRWAEFSFKFSNEELGPLLAQFMERVMKILDENGITYSKPVLASLIRRYKADFRKILNELQKMSLSGSIDTSSMTQSDSTRMDSLISMMKAKKFKDIRQFFAENQDLVGEEFFESFYSGISSYLQPASIPSAVLLIAEYQYKAAFVVNQEINVCACAVELMTQCEFK